MAFINNKFDSFPDATSMKKIMYKNTIQIQDAFRNQLDSLNQVINPQNLALGAVIKNELSELT
jgi:hypothetical protein